MLPFSCIKYFFSTSRFHVEKSVIFGKSKVTLCFMDKIADFLNYLKFERRNSPHTVTAYRTDLEQFRRYLSEKGGGKADAATIRAWLDSRMEQGDTPRSIRRKMSSLKAYFRFLQREHGLDSNPMDRMLSPKMAERLPSFVTEPQMEQLMETLEAAADSFETIRDAMMVETFYALGIRESELIALRRSDVDLAQLQVRVLGKGNKERLLPFMPAFRDHLTAYMAAWEAQFGPMRPESPLFVTAKGRPLYPMLVYRVVHESLEMTSVRKKSPHVLRHTFATHLLDEGAELNAIKELLGHANLAATQVYTHTSIAKLKKIYQQSHPRE